MLWQEAFWAAVQIDDQPNNLSCSVKIVVVRLRSVNLNNLLCYERDASQILLLQRGIVGSKQYRHSVLILKSLKKLYLFSSCIKYVQCPCAAAKGWQEPAVFLFLFFHFICNLRLIHWNSSLCSELTSQKYGRLECVSTRSDEGNTHFWM